jgi:hypothetical protein
MQIPREFYNSGDVAGFLILSCHISNRRLDTQQARTLTLFIRDRGEGLGFSSTPCPS